MKNKNDEFMYALDYVMNKADLRQIDVFEAAVTERKSALEQRTGIISLNPQEAAKKMSASIEESLQTGMNGVRNTFRSFAEDMLKKEAPELSKQDMAKLVDSWIPSGKKSPLVVKGKVAGIPSDALYDMIMQFVFFSIGEMPAAEDRSLRQSIGEWPAKYWKKFPPEIRRIIKAFLDGQTTSKQFDKEIRNMLEIT